MTDIWPDITYFDMLFSTHLCAHRRMYVHYIAIEKLNRFQTHTILLTPFDSYSPWYLFICSKMWNILAEWFPNIRIYKTSLLIKLFMWLQTKWVFNPYWSNVYHGYFFEYFCQMSPTSFATMIPQNCHIFVAYSNSNFKINLTICISKI